MIDWGGEKLPGLVEFTRVPLRVQLEFVSAKTSPPQGIQVRMRGGSLVVNGQEGVNFTLWHDATPRFVDLEVHPAGRGTPSLKLWNIWRGGLDVTQAWLGNSAMKVDGDIEGSSFVLRCSDGEGKPDFDDLVVAVRLDR